MSPKKVILIDICMSLRNLKKTGLSLSREKTAHMVPKIFFAEKGMAQTPPPQ
jgi:hypothetical protein